MRITRTRPILLIIVSLLFLNLPVTSWAAQHNSDQESAAKTSRPGVVLSREVGSDISRQASQVRQDLEQRARSLFQRQPLEFDWQTAVYLSEQIAALPLRIPQLMQEIAEQGRVLGVVGSLLVATFLVALIYSFLGRKRLMARIETRLTPLKQRFPETVYPVLLSLTHVIIAALFPLVLLAAFRLISDLLAYQAVWFLLVGRLLLLWAAGSLVINLLAELLTRERFSIDQDRGKSLFLPARIVVIYCICVIGLYWTAASFQLRQDVLALLQFAISLSIIGILFLLLLKKRTLLSLLPDLPHAGYRKFCRFLAAYYFPLIVLSLALAILWALGYRAFGRVLLSKIWSSVGGYLAIMVVYHHLLNALRRWYGRTDHEDETAVLVFRSVKGLLIYATTLATILVVFNLLGILGIVKQAISFTVFTLGSTGISLWIILEATLILLAFIFFSRLLQAYLDYKVYPVMGIEPGLGYAINTFLKYMILAIGLLIALNVVGIDLRLLMVFAGAIGIGIGMGLQNIAANVISGFTLIFGGKLRKGDWIEVADTMGKVTDIHLRATKVRTRDNIEYLIPNTKFISDVLVNYSLGSPLIRIAVPVGVSYSAPPEAVRQILLGVAAADRLVAKEKPPVVYFSEFGDSSLNFNLLVWIDVRTTAVKGVRSSLYFAIFEALANAGIEIPFPQRDIHIRSTAVDTEPE